ncbi:MAG: diphosphomevalonate decarboxylase [Bacteroidetes bacterium]|nr:diphosphomevalonate decarboxylase [Bacteroidota bacterium]
MLQLDFAIPKDKLSADKIESANGSVTWRSPSNIALIKYWGKYGFQFPRNPSVSLTLSESHTTTKLEYMYREPGTHADPVRLFFHGSESPAFLDKIDHFFKVITEFFPFIPQFSFTIFSENSFPHSAGIASSASSMSALALCLCSIERDVFGGLEDDESFYHKASFISRIGSGSASRSVYPGIALWGMHDHFDESSQEYAIPFYEDADPVFLGMRDAVLILDSNEKSVSSRAGHALMEGNPFANVRYEQVENHLLTMVETLKRGDLLKFGEIVEQEALTLHALMMTSKPSYLLMKPATIEVINRLRSWRSETGIPAFFTLDAGPNVHLLYPLENTNEVETFIKDELLQFCEDGRWIRDHVGQGPVRLKSSDE